MTIIFDKTLASNADCTTWRVHTDEECTLRELVEYAKQKNRFFDIREGHFLGRVLYDNRPKQVEATELMDRKVRLIRMSNEWGQTSYVVEF